MSDPTWSEELHRQYDRALAEYRFQVELNWRRSQYFFVLNVGVLVAAATMFSSEDVPRPLVAVLFAIGALLALLSILANGAQHNYYRAARDLKQRLEQRMALDDLSIVTTPGMGSPLEQVGRVRTFLKIMLIAIALADVVGAAYAIDDARHDTAEESPRAVVVDLKAGDALGAGRVLAVSQDGDLMEVRRLKHLSERLLLKVPPGTYLLSLGGSAICRRIIEVGQAPLQVLSMNCKRRGLMGDPGFEPGTSSLSETRSNQLS